MKNETRSHQKLQIKASDDYPLQVRIYENKSENQEIILIAGATGVPQRYYKRFATLMVSKGFRVITFDFRGIADSKYRPLKGFRASVLDWVQKDFKSVLTWTLDQYGSPYVIGHSLGGHIFGVLSESNQSKGLITFGTGAGWHGWMPGLERYRIAFLWNFLAPILVPMFGYLPSKKVGIGENLPLQVYSQWKYWCSFPHYWFDDPNCKFQHNFSAIRVPVTAVNSTDDLWAPPKSASAFMQYYDETNLSYVTVTAENWGVSRIGHMGYFHSDCLEKTTDLIIDFIKS